jgi:hypothetical protein
MNILPVDRALIIYGALANRSDTKGARERLSEHLMKMYIAGEKDEHRLTVEGLSYLHNLIGKSIPEIRAVSCPFVHLAAFAGSFAALFSLWRLGLLQPSLTFVSVGAASLPFPQLAS